MTKEFEPLPPFQPQLHRQEKLSYTISLKKHALLMAPHGSLNLSKSNGTAQFIHVLSDEAQNVTKKYLSKKKDMRLIRALAQKGYNRKILPLLEQALAAEKAYRTSAEKVAEVYEKLPETRKKLVEPVTLTDAQYSAKWLAMNYQTLPPPVSGFKTRRGEIMRSKSECLIANLLTQHGIPYRYEYPLQLKSNWKGPCAEDEFTEHLSSHRIITLHPDFYCLNLRTRKEIAFEHFGMLDNPEYARKMITKLVCYCDNDFYPGDNLIFTYETNGRFLQIEAVETLIFKFLK